MILIEIQVQNRVLQNAKKKEYCKKKEQKSDEQNRLFFFQETEALTKFFLKSL